MSNRTEQIIRVSALSTAVQFAQMIKDLHYIWSLSVKTLVCLGNSLIISPHLEQVLVVDDADLRKCSK